MSSTVISFLATGHVEQRVKILKEGLTPEALVEGLNNGTYVTTVSGDSIIELVDLLDVNKNPKVAEIEETDNQIGYADFEEKQ